MTTARELAQGAAEAVTRLRKVVVDNDNTTTKGELVDGSLLAIAGAFAAIAMVMTDDPTAELRAGS